MGATLWHPDGEDPVLDKARRRAEEALRESGENEAQGIVWKLPAGLPPRRLPAPGPSSVDPSEPFLWRPKPLAALGPANPVAAKTAAEELTIIVPARKKSRGRAG